MGQPNLSDATKAALQSVALPDIITPAKLAEHLGWSVRFVVELLEDEELPGRKIRGCWLISRGELMRFLSRKNAPSEADMAFHKAFGKELEDELWREPK